MIYFPPKFRQQRLYFSLLLFFFFFFKLCGWIQKDVQSCNDDFLIGHFTFTRRPMSFPTNVGFSFFLFINFFFGISFVILSESYGGNQKKIKNNNNHFKKWRKKKRYRETLNPKWLGRILHRRSEGPFQTQLETWDRPWGVADYSRRSLFFWRSVENQRLMHPNSSEHDSHWSTGGR